MSRFLDVSQIIFPFICNEAGKHEEEGGSNWGGMGRYVLTSLPFVMLVARFGVIKLVCFTDPSNHHLFCHFLLEMKIL